LWGAASSSHQVEGGNTANDWALAESAGKVPPAGIACDSWSKRRDDVALAVRLGLKAYRFSLEWSRLQPTYGTFDDTAAEYYRALIADLLAHNIVPVVTINHFTLPRWFYENGGWLAPESAEVFDAFVHRVTLAFAQCDVRYWITINEPNVYAYKGFLEGTWPPFAKNYAKARLALMNLKAAHMRAYRTLKRAFPSASVSYAHHYRWFKPCDRSGVRWMNAVAASARHTAFNDDFLSWAVRENYLDFIALNYYTGEYTVCDKSAPFGRECDCHRGVHPQNSLGWHVSPDGLHEALCGLVETGLPIIVTENGFCGEDADAEVFLDGHLRATARAIKKGVDVRGYFYWSLTDNYEWAEGYRAMFGLADRERREKPFAAFYEKIIAHNALGA
jgi:beta-glucosidase